MNLDFANRLLENFTHEKQGEALAMFTEDGVFEDYTLGFRVEGTEQIKGLFQDFFDTTKWQHDFNALSYKGDETGGAIEYTWVMHADEFMGFPTNGQPLNIRGVYAITLRDGKISSLVDYWDAAILLRQLDTIK
jgi:steroid delta-isomerase-like uncharacterized protein